MTWLVILSPSGAPIIEHHALVPGHAAVISRHASYPEAAAALVAYRDRMEREAIREQGQRELFG